MSSADKKIYILTSLFICAIIIPFMLRGSGPPHSVTNMGYPINTRGDDFAPSLTADGSVMVFSSREVGEDNHNIYICYRQGSTWSKPQLFEALNSTFNEETPYISHDGTMIVFASDRPASLKPPPTSERAGRITFDIFYSKKEGDTWTKPVPVQGDVNTTWNERAPALSRDKKTLYFSRWPYKYIKKASIYRADLKNGAYSGSRELPSPINTGNMELGLRESLSGEGFYFSSMREGGYGGWDIYFVPRRNGGYGTVQNLGPQVNTPGNELFYNDPPGYVYFCSNRKDSLGQYDIYSAIAGDTEPREVFVKAPEQLPEKEQSEVTAQPPSETKTVPEPETSIKISAAPQKKTRITFILLDEASGKPLSIDCTILLKDSISPQTPALRTITRKSNSQGRIMVLPKSDVRYIVIHPASKDTVFMTQIAVEPHKEQKISIFVKKKNAIKPETGREPSPAKRGEAMEKELKIVTSDIPLQNILFDYKSTSIRLEYYPYIHRLINSMRDDPKLKLLIIGHADIKGSDYINDRLSKERARVVKEYFVRMGIDEDRLKTKGVGSRYPLIRKERGDFSEINRRVEFRFVDF